MAFRVAALWAYGAGLSMQCPLFFYYIMAWRNLPQAKGSVSKFQLSLVLYLSQGVCSILAKFVVHRVQEVHGCVPVTILDLSKKNNF
jgi:hypothetical protein